MRAVMAKKKEKKFNFKEGPSTDELSKYIPLKNLKAYIYIYNILKDIEHYSIEPPPSIKIIDEEIWKLIDDGWIDENIARDCFELIHSHVHHKNKKDLNMLIRFLRFEMESTVTEITDDGILTENLNKRGIRKYFAINFLFYILGIEKHSHNKQPTYPLISDFLKEQGLNYDADQMKVYVHRIHKSPEELYMTAKVLLDYLKLCAEGRVNYDKQIINKDSIKSLSKIISTIPLPK